MSFIAYEFFIKDIDKDTHRTAVYKFVLYFITFVFAILYTQSFLKNESEPLQNFTKYEFEGKVLKIENSETSKMVLVETNKIFNLQENTLENKGKNLISINVSPFKEVNLFDRVYFQGEINNYDSTFSIEGRQLFFQNEYEKLFYNSEYIVSWPDKFDTIDSQKSFIEKTLLSFYTYSETMQKQVEKFIYYPQVGIAQGITFGNQKNLPKDINDMFKNSGLIHIMVLSGANVSFIILIFFFVFRKFKIKYKIMATMFMSFIFILSTGLTAPSIRAGIMANMTILGEYFSKNFTTEKSLLFSLFILTLINPKSLLGSPSLHLSFLACFGLFILSKNIKNFLDKLSNIKSVKYKNTLQNLIIFISLFLGIFLSTAPYILALSRQTNWLGIFFTFLLEPIIMLVTILTFLITLISFLPFSLDIILGNIFGFVNTFFINIIYKAAEFGNQEIFQINFFIDRNFLIIYYLILFSLTFYYNYKYEKRVF